MQAFIKGVGIISPQKTFDNPDFLSEINTSEDNFMHCIEPSYSLFLNPVMSRRMGRIVKMAIAASSVCLKDAGVTMPDAIITGTALGCLADTEKFVTAMIADDELYLTPVPFIQSIQNTAAAQIALQLKCTNHNFTHSHKGISFESAALDAMMLLSDTDARNILVGGLDEMTTNNHFVFGRVNRWKEEQILNTDLIRSKTKGTIAGEGAAFFVFSNEENKNNYAIIKGIEIIYKPESYIVVENKVDQLLAFNSISVKDIDLVLYGISGDKRYDNIHYHLKENFFTESSSGYFKHLCGEYQTASGFAMWMAAQILKKQFIPPVILFDEARKTTIKNILIFNNYENENLSAILMSAI